MIPGMKAAKADPSPTTKGRVHCLFIMSAANAASVIDHGHIIHPIGVVIEIAAAPEPCILLHQILRN